MLQVKKEAYNKRNDKKADGYHVLFHHSSQSIYCNTLLYTIWPAGVSMNCTVWKNEIASLSSPLTGSFSLKHEH